MFFSLLRVSMDFIEDIWIRKERSKAGFSAKIDRPAAVLSAREVGWIGITENPSTEGDEARMVFGRDR
jgi:hypothetical protein